MKKTVLLFIYFVLFLSSCSSNHSKDVYFVHTAAFFQNGNSINISAVMEKQNAKDNEEYFVGSANGKTISDAVKNMSDKYSECYFATCEIYIIKENSDVNFINKLAELCENPFLPSHARIACVKDEGLQEILEDIKQEEQLKELLKQTDSGKVTFIHFLAKCLSDSKSIKIPILSINGNGKAQVTGNAVFKGKLSV